VEYTLQEWGGSSVPSSMALRSTKYDRQLRFFSVLNFFSSSFFSLCFSRSFSDRCCFNHCDLPGRFRVCFGFVSFLEDIGSFVFSLVLLEECARILALL
jgi:hypothetical protein